MQNIVDEVRKNVITVKNGFKPMEEKAKKIFQTNSTENIRNIAYELYCSKEHQIRMVAVFLFGYLSALNVDVFSFLKTDVSLDENWRVQEILAMSFDQYCKDISYEKAIPDIELWLNSKTANVRRAVTEGLRIWTARPYFKENPNVAIQFLSNLKQDDSEYVRKSVGNALRDISKKHAELVKTEILAWDLTNRNINHVFKLVVKKGLLS